MYQGLASLICNQTGVGLIPIVSTNLIKKNSMKLSTSNLTTKLYLWFYGKTERELPTNLCPYFWKLVLMFLLIVPYSVFCVPVIIYEVVMKLWKNEDSDSQNGERILFSFVTYLGLTILSSLVVAITLFWNSYPHKTNPILNNLSILGVMLWFVILVVGSYHLIKGIYEYIREKNHEKKFKYDENGYRIYPEPKVNIVKEFVKAKYHKYCPRIEWVSDKK